MSTVLLESGVVILFRLACEILIGIGMQRANKLLIYDS
jgi:hypothetical protein